jgi:hypothetical protein
LNARLYYLIRIGTAVALLLGIPLVMAIKGEKPNAKAMIALLAVDAVLVAYVVHAVLKLRKVPPTTEVRFAGPTHAEVHAAAIRGSRRLPLLTFGGGVVGLLLSYWLWTQGRGHLVALIATPVLLLLGIGGLIHPPVFYALRKDLPDQPGGAKAIGFFLIGIGLLIGGFAAWWVLYRH